MSGWLSWALAGLLSAGMAPDPNDPNPEPDPTPDPNDPPDPPPEPPDPDPPSRPEPVPTEGNPEPEPGDDGGDEGGDGDGGTEPGDDGGDEGGDGGDGDGSSADVTPAPFAQLDVADRESELDLGGDLTVGPLCKDDRPEACDNFRVGLRLRMPVTQSSTSGSGRAAIDSLNGFAGAWRVGGVFDWIRDVTREDLDSDEPSPAKFYMLSLQASWGVQTFQFSPGVSGQAKETRHSVHTLARFLAYVHPPRKTRVAPQVLVRYDRQWSSSDPVGVFVDDGDPDTPMFTVPVIIDGPVARPVFAATVPVLVSVQSGKGRGGRVLSQLGFGPAVSYAASGGSRGYTPFDDLHVLRFESWIYWYPLGKSAQLAATKPNARIGVSPFVDVFVAGRAPGQPTVDFGVLAEVKVGVRGYEY